MLRRDETYNLIDDPELQEQLDEFNRQMEQTTEFYQRATMFLAAIRIKQLENLPYRMSRRRRGLLWAFSRLRRFSPRRRVAKKEAWRPTITIIDMAPLDPLQDNTPGQVNLLPVVSEAKGESDE